MPTKNVYFTDEQYSTIVYYAVDNNFSVTDVVRWIIEEGLKVLEKEKLEQLPKKES